jgi:hypothetical protein
VLVGGILLKSLELDREYGCAIGRYNTLLEVKELILKEQEVSNECN